MYQLLCEFEFEGKPWEKHELYWDRSPIAHITAASTPMLLTHGEQVSLCMMLLLWLLLDTFIQDGCSTGEVVLRY